MALSPKSQQIAATEAFEEVCEKIHEAADSEETTFNCAYNTTLRRFPEDVKIMRPFLQILHINNCYELSEIPPAVGDLSNLRWLNVSYNKISVIPPEICRLRNLERLHVNNNLLQALPIEVWSLKGLQELHCDSNQLRALPTGILFLTKLRELFVNNNPLIGESDADGAEVAELFPPLPYGDCSNCNVRFTKAIALCSFHSICGAENVPFSHYVCSPTCEAQLKLRLATVADKEKA